MVRSVTKWHDLSTSGEVSKTTLQKLRKKSKKLNNTVIIHLDTFQSHPYRYTKVKLDEVDVENIDILVGL